MSPSPVGDDALTLAHYASAAYLEYALSVVKGRALPDVCDGQKPVQRRILYAMQRMGLAANGSKPVKSARVGGVTCWASYHPHGDTGRLRRAGAPGAGLLRCAIRSSTGQGNFRQPRRRRRRRHALHGSPPERRSPACCSTRLGMKARTTSCPTTTGRSRSRSQPAGAPAHRSCSMAPAGIAVGMATEIPSPQPARGGRRPPWP